MGSALNALLVRVAFDASENPATVSPNEENMTSKASCVVDKETQPLANGRHFSGNLVFDKLKKMEDAAVPFRNTHDANTWWSRTRESVEIDFTNMKLVPTPTPYQLQNPPTFSGKLPSVIAPSTFAESVRDVREPVSMCPTPLPSPRSSPTRRPKPYERTSRSIERSVLQGVIRDLEEDALLRGMQLTLCSCKAPAIRVVGTKTGKAYWRCPTNDCMFVKPSAE
jgi:hypothetical protein